MNSQKMTMVVARYNENLDWLKEVPWNYIVYNKGEDLPAWIKNEIKLQDNIGREAYAYLTYIVDNYDTLPDYIIFAQGYPFDHSRDFIKKINDFDGKDDFFSLSDSVCISNLSEMGLDMAKSVRKLFLDDIKSFEYPEGAQFILSNKTILFHTKMTYQKIIDFMMEAENMIDDKATGYRVFSAKFPQGRKRMFDTKMTYQEIIDSIIDERHIFDEEGKIFSAFVMEVLWKTLFDNEHKTVYD